MSELEDEFIRQSIKKIVHKDDDNIVEESTEKCNELCEQFNENRDAYKEELQRVN